MVEVDASVSVAVPALPPVIETDAGLNEQVGTLVPEVGATEQVSATLPVKPPLGVTVTVDVPLLPAVSVIAPLFVSATAGTAAADTVTATVVLSVTVPSTPVTVTV